MPLYRGEPAMRRARAAELRAAGQSLRQIAAALRVSHQTVANDLARADLDRATVTPLPLSSSAVNFRPPAEVIVKPPAKYRQELATVGEMVLGGTSTEEAATARLIKATRKEKGFAARVLADYVARSLKRWLDEHRALSAQESAGQLLFPGLELPRQLEVSPNRFKPLGDMTRGDWVAARRQARTKADNASGYADLLDLTDDELTTAQVLRRAA